MSKEAQQWDGAACEEAIRSLMEAGMTRAEAEEEHALRVRRETVLGPQLTSRADFERVRRHKLW